MSTQKIGNDEFEEFLRLSNRLVDILSKSGMKHEALSLSTNLQVIVFEMRERLGE